MFINPPKILGHKSLFINGNFVTPEYILSLQQNDVHLFKRYCPHRQYPISTPGSFINDITCDFHGLQWSSAGEPKNHPYKLKCGTAKIGKSGLIFLNWNEPVHKWIDDIAAQSSLEYSHSCFGKSETGSYLWLMEVMADYLHVRQSKIHPELSKQVDLDRVIMDQGTDWILQTHGHNWTSIFIFPYSFVEYKQGCLSVNYVIPNDINNEFGFEWITQFFYNNSVSQTERDTFESLEFGFREDVSTIEKQKGGYYPLKFPLNHLEDHCIVWGNWVKNNRRKNDSSY